MNEQHCDVLIIGSGAGGGTVASVLAELPSAGLRVLLLEQGPKLADTEFTGSELDMADALYESGGAFLTADGAMTLAFGRLYGGSTVVYTGTSLLPPARVITDWNVRGLDADDLQTRAQKYLVQNHVHYLSGHEINDNNRLFVEGARAAGYQPEQFPVNVNGCMGSRLCNLGCPNGAKMGTHRVQLPQAEAAGVEVVTRAEVLRIEERAAVVHVHGRQSGEKGELSAWAPGEYRVRARMIIVCGGAIGTSALLLRSGFEKQLPRLGHRFTCHPAQILVAEHAQAITNAVGFPKSYYVDRAAEEGFVLETCMYFPFTTAKNMTGFGEEHSRFMRAFARLQMILVLACDRATPENRITIDRAGHPVVHYTFTREVVGSLVAATRAATRIFFAAGALRVHAPTAEPTTIEAIEQHRLNERIDAMHFLPGRTSVSAAHLMGGCAMGESRANSVTDSFGRVHGVPWLRIADSSLFPDALQINPYLTVMALADRVAETARSDLAELRAIPV